jgi:hypothetical protein
MRPHFGLAEDPAAEARDLELEERVCIGHGLREASGKTRSRSAR